jgi:hypothetical protein
MHPIEMHKASTEFTRCWDAAGNHIQSRLQDPLRSWLKANLTPPFLEHLSFRLGNQLFFIRIEDVDGELDVPGSRQGLLAIAEGCKGYPCLMPMRQRAESWEPEEAGWGLLDARTGETVDPVVLVSDERIEMTNWELQDFAVQIVRGHLEKTGSKLMSWNTNPEVNPSIWFVGKSGPEWVVVRAARSPLTQAEPPANWQEIAEGCARISKVGHFASVTVANADDRFERSAAILASPLWRGHGLAAQFQGLIAGSAILQPSAQHPQKPWLENARPKPPEMSQEAWEDQLEEEWAWRKHRERQRGGPEPMTSLDQNPAQKNAPQQSDPQGQQKPSHWTEEAWQDHLEEVKAFNKRVWRQSGGRLDDRSLKASPPKQGWSLFSYLFGPRGEGR